MGGKAELHAGSADGVHVGRGKVLLPEMHEVAALLDGDPPVIVDDELAAVLGADGFRPADFRA